MHTLETTRLRLRPWRPEDREPFARLNADPRVMEYFPAPLEREESDTLAARIEARMDEQGWGFWALERKADATFIGFTGLNRPTVKLPCAPCIEIGWRLAHGAWGQGYASEAARAALRFGFEPLGLDEIVAFTAEGNLRSLAVMERIGMRPRGGFEHPALPPGHALRAHRLYALEREVWRHN